MNGGGVAGNGTSGFRDPFALLLLIPGADYASSSFAVNGAPVNTQNILIDGQTANHTGAGTTGLTQQMQPSVDSIQEVAVQTSNLQQEFGVVEAAASSTSSPRSREPTSVHGTLHDYHVRGPELAQSPTRA